MSQFSPVLELSSMQSSQGFRIEGEAENSNSGRSVSAAGDVNGDGYADLIIGAPGVNAGPGTTYVVFGKASGFGTKVDLYTLDGLNGFRMFTPLTNEGGQCVASAGDINGDGYDDVIVGADEEAHVVFGRKTGFAANLDLSSLDGLDGFRIAGGDDHHFGDQVSAAGDVNGDGFADIMIGADTGDAYVILGKEEAFDATVDVSPLDGADGFRIKGPRDVIWAAYSIASAGDINGDGFSDLIVGAAKVHEQESDYHGDNFRPLAYVVFGNGSAFPETVRLSALDGAQGFLVEGEAIRRGSSTYFEVSTAGDLNADGYDDLIVGCIGTSDEAGYAAVVFGSAAPFAPTVALALLDGSDGFRIVAEPYTHSGGLVSSGGDVNGDGYDDVIVGAGEDFYLIFGKRDGFDAQLALVEIDGNNGFKVVAPDGKAISSVASAGDVDGDGFDDLIAGLPGDSDASGTSFVIFGQRPSEATIVIGSAVGNTIHGSGYEDVLSGRGGNDTLIGYSGSDVLRGGAGRDLLIGGSDEADTLDGGLGADVFQFALNHASTVLDHDTIIGADLAEDKWDTFIEVEAIDPAILTGSLSSATFYHDLENAVGHVAGGHAVLFTADAGDLAGSTFLFVSDPAPTSFNWNIVIQLVDPVNLDAFDLGDFI
jgi:hypothetical protein